MFANWVEMYLILYDALNSSPAEIETVTEAKITTYKWFGATASKLL